MKKILIVEDDAALRRELASLLEGAGYETVALTEFSRAEQAIREAGADLILLDINLPSRNGQTLLRDLRKTLTTPILVVTSRLSEADEVLAMSCGADDYITKPYNPTILLLRIGAVFRRMEPGGRRYRDLTADPARGTLSGERGEVVLTKNEMIVFSLLLEHQGRIVSRDMLMTALWDNDELVSDSALTVNISRLRAKLSAFGYDDAIETRKKQGYVLL